MNNQKDLFEDDKTPEWEKHWKDMPEYNNVKTPEPAITVLFKFRTEEDFQKFKRIIKDCLYNGAKPFDGMQRKEKKQAWYPHKEKASKYLYVDEDK